MDGGVRPVGWKEVKRMEWGELGDGWGMGWGTGLGWVFRVACGILVILGIVYRIKLIAGRTKK